MFKRQSNLGLFLYIAAIEFKFFSHFPKINSHPDLVGIWAKPERLTLTTLGVYLEYSSL